VAHLGPSRTDADRLNAKHLPLASAFLIAYRKRMKHPTLQFNLSPELDQKMAWEFFQQSMHGGDLFWETRAVLYHEELKHLGQQKQPKKFLNHYVHNTYSENIESLQARLDEIEELWTEQQSTFFSETDKRFPTHPWPHAHVTAYGSLFDFCPRFLQEGSFQIFLGDTDEGVLFTIAHELLHIIFYDFVNTHRPTFKTLETESGVFWELAELFNIVIQDTPAFINLHGSPGPTSYTDLAPYVEHAKQIWKKDVLSWLDEMIVILSK